MSEFYNYNPSGVAQGVPTTDLTWSGLTRIVTVDTNAVGFGALLSMSADGNYDEADADQTTTMGPLAIALQTGTGSKLVLIQGLVKNNAWAWTVGGVNGDLYASTVQGTMVNLASKPTGSGDVVRKVGSAVSATVIDFRPEQGYSVVV